MPSRAPLRTYSNSNITTYSIDINKSCYHIRIRIKSEFEGLAMENFSGFKWIGIEDGGECECIGFDIMGPTFGYSTQKLARGDCDGVPLDNGGVEEDIGVVGEVKKGHGVVKAAKGRIGSLELEVQDQAKRKGTSKASFYQECQKESKAFGENQPLFYCYLDRERPKFQLKEDAETPRNGQRALGEASGIVKVTTDSRVEDFVQTRKKPCKMLSGTSVLVEQLVLEQPRVCLVAHMLLLRQGKVNNDTQEHQKSKQSTNSSDSSRPSLDCFDEQKEFPRSRQARDEGDNARIFAASSSGPLSILLIPSLKEVSN
ncbi:unnamed protein product [Ilex paraguariensis]|uniref:Uncharacterized protein n=1 Tax=Ilex paraguariensis TaxID=185542 RepID=A0ABC8U0F8_9AQUA